MSEDETPFEQSKLVSRSVRHVDESTKKSALLLYVPLTDPSSGYHSLSYLRARAEEEGWSGIDIVDGNIESFWSTLDGATAGEIVHAGKESTSISAWELESAESDDARLQLLSCKRGLQVDELRHAIEVLTHEDRFFNYAEYAVAVDRVSGWMNQASLLGIPGTLRGGFSQGLQPLPNANIIDHLTNAHLLERFNKPFERYLDDLLVPSLEPYPIVGINVTYISQIALALHWSRRMRAVYPEKFICFGGTEVSDIWKYIECRDRYFELFDAADVVLLGEGETAFVEILNSVKECDYTNLPSGAMANPARLPSARRSLPVLQHEPTKTIPTPRFDDLPFDKYLAPYRLIYYSPTRGCYWNKCTFCDYGLNTDAPTSPWRQDPVDKMVSDLDALSDVAPYVYFSVDVLAPATLLGFAERASMGEVSVKWAAELRLEKYWSSERAASLARAGCVALSVGFESGNKRVLDLIDKGTAPERILEVTTALHNSGIGVEMMGFTGFPSETIEEAIESASFLKTHRDIWTFGGTK